MKKIIENNLRSNYIIHDGKRKEKAKQYLYSEMIKQSERVRIDINKSNDPIDMLDKSLLCIYFLTGDQSFYEQNRDKLIRFIAEYNYNKQNDG